MSKTKTSISALLFTGLMLSTPLLATAQDDPLPPGEHGDRGHGGPFMHELRELDLSSAQEEKIRRYVRAAHEQGRAGFEAMLKARHAFETTAPNSAGYGTVVSQTADNAANAAREHVQMEAALRAQVYSVLTDAQKSQLASRLASLPELPARLR